MVKKYFFIVNPASSSGKTSHFWEKFRKIAPPYIKDSAYNITRHPNHATDLAREALKDGFTHIIALGGDGTLNEVLNGFFQKDSDELISPEAVLGIYATGTGTDFARFLKIPRNIHKWSRMVLHNSPRKVDIGKITHIDQNNKSHCRYFINVSDFGLGAEVLMQKIFRETKSAGPLSYYAALLAAIKKYRSRAVKITIDHSKTIEGSYLIGAVANGGIFGGGMKISPESQVDNGFLELVLIGDMTRFEIIRESRRLYTGTILKNKKVSSHKIKHLRVESSQKVFIEHDGEMGPELPVEFECLPQSINFLIS